MTFEIEHDPEDRRALEAIRCPSCHYSAFQIIKGIPEDGHRLAEHPDLEGAFQCQRGKPVKPGDRRALQDVAVIMLLDAQLAALDDALGLTPGYGRDDRA